MCSFGSPLLRVATAVNGRLGLKEGTTLTITSETLAYGRYVIPLAAIEQAEYEQNTCTLIIHFCFRAKPKHFALSSADECHAVCEMLAELLAAIDARGGANERAVNCGARAASASPADSPPPTHLARRHSSPMVDTAFQKRQAVSLRRGCIAAQSSCTPSLLSPGVGADSDSDDGEHDGDDAEPRQQHQDRDPSWYFSVLNSSTMREVVASASDSVRGGACCLHHPLEAILFGVLLPLVAAATLLHDENRSSTLTSSSTDRMCLVGTTLVHLPFMPNRVVT